MSIEDDKKLLQAVRDYRPPAELHPIAMNAWGHYEAAGNKLTNEGVEALRGELNALKPDLQKLGEAIFGVARFMIYVTESLGDKAAGEKIADLIREYAHLYEPFWQQVGEAIANLGGEAAAAFQSFAGKDAPKTAPVFGKAAPEGSVPLRNIAPPTNKPPQAQRPPPWKKK